MSRKMMGMKPPKNRIMLNVGGLFDIPSSTLVTGARGESIIMGGLADVEALTGSGNSFKSVIAYYLLLASANVIASTHSPYATIYDTENNLSEQRMNNLAKRFEYLAEDIFDLDNGGFVEHSNKSVMHGDTYWNDLKKFLKEVEKLNSDKVEYTGLLDRKGKVIVDFLPILALIDSFSNFESKASLDLLDKAKLDDNSTATYFLKSGNFKTKVLNELSMIAPRTNTFFLTTAHIGLKSTMNENKYSKPAKALAYLKDGEDLKNVTKSFTYLTKILYKTLGVSPLKADDGVSPLYPTKGAVNTKSDLNLIKIEALRNKNGASGVTLPLIISQADGVLPSLTEFHYIKSAGYFGLGGNNRSFHSVFLPKVSLSRTTIRTKLDSNKKLRRAIQITADLLQFEEFKPEIGRAGLWLSPEDLYNEIIKKGYDWDMILETRSWFAIDQYSDKIPHFLSTLDLLNMVAGTYVPYWLDNTESKKKK